MMHDGGVPLYTLTNGTRFRHIDFYHNETFTFVKHSDYQFPAHFILKRHAIIYQYKVAIPGSAGHRVVFVDETSMVSVLEFP